MLKRTMGGMVAAVLALAPALQAQAAGSAKDTVVDGRRLSEWVKDLKAQAPQVRNAAAYEISGLGPSAAPAVPALIEALDDSDRQCPLSRDGRVGRDRAERLSRGAEAQADDGRRAKR